MNGILDSFKKELSECKGIISNKPTFDGFTPIESSEINLFWPCIHYQVEVHVQNSKLDIFESTILKLAECKITEPNELAAILCMKKQTVDFIQNRLANKSLLTDGTFLPTKKGKEILDDFSKGNTGESKIVSLFFDLNSGRFLDFVCENPAKTSFRGAFPSKKDPQNLVARFAEGGKSFLGNIVVPNNINAFLKNKEHKPETFKILRTIKKFQKNSPKDCPIQLNEKSTSAQIKGSELILVHTKAFSTISGGIFSTDIGGLGVCDVFTDFLRKADEKDYHWLSEIFKNSDVESEKKEEKSLEEKIYFEYPEISRDLYNCAIDLKKLGEIQAKENSSYKDEAKRIGEKIIYTLYTRFEYALQMYYKFFHDETEEENARIRSANTEARKINERIVSEIDTIDENTLLFYILAKDLGFSVTSDDTSLLKVNQRKINAMRNGEQPELTALLCLCLSSAQGDDESPMALLAKERAEFIKDIFEIKSLRDNTLMAHGPGLAFDAVSEKHISEIFEKIIFYSNFLNKELSKDFKIIRKIFNGNPKESSKYDDILQKRYSATILLYKEFGNRTINSLPQFLRKQMINWHETLDEKRFVATSCCSLLQQFFDKAVLSLLRNVSPPEKDNRTAKEAQKKCLAAGFFLKNGRLPPSLDLVKRKNINKAVCGGGKSTFGAVVIAFILLLDKYELSDIATRQQNLLQEIQDLLQARRHADMKIYSDEEVSSYKKTVTKILKEIIEFI